MESMKLTDNLLPLFSRFKFIKKSVSVTFVPIIKSLLAHRIVCSVFKLVVSPSKPFAIAFVRRERVLFVSVVFDQAEVRCTSAVRQRGYSSFGDQSQHL